MSLTYQELLHTITDPGESGIHLLDPATGESIGWAPTNTAADVDAAVRDAAAAQKDWARRTDEERCRVLLDAASAIEDNAEALAELLSREQGKPLDGPNARFEVGACVNWLRATAAISLEDKTLVDDSETRAVLSHRPIGVVGAIGPWNWPMMITVWQIAPALRMGNAVVVKPSEYTPLSVLGLLHVLNTVVPAGLLSAVIGGGDIGAALTDHPDVGKIMFTGSTATGQKVAAAAARGTKRVTLELGGNDAGIVLDDADPRQIAEQVFWGAFLNTGQTCAALKRLYVPDSLYDDMCTALVDIARAMPMGVGVREGNVLGPLQNRQQYDIVDNLVEQAKANGARILLGGDPDHEATGNFYPTTLVADVDPDEPLVIEEQFGPALPIVRYTDLDWAIDEANKLDVGLGASVWSSDTERAWDVARRIEAGTVWINKHGAVDPRIPFGGIKGSGYGVEFGLEGLLELAVPHVISA